MRAAQQMVWTGLHENACSEARDIPAREGRPPCDGCYPEQRRACGSRSLTCTAYLRYVHAATNSSAAVTRDVDDEPALAELTPLVYVCASNDRARKSVMLRSRKIVAAWMGLDTDTSAEEHAAKVAARKITTGSPARQSTELQAEIIAAVQQCDGTISGIRAITGRDRETIRTAAQRMVRHGLLTREVRLVERRRGSAHVISYRVP